MAKHFTMKSELLAELVNNRGFKPDGHGNLVYERGSISNYVTLKIHTPRPYCSLAANEEYVPACYVQYERYTEPGYLECDWKRTEEGYVAESNLLNYLDEKNIR